jgi:hypothetical protein
VTFGVRVDDPPIGIDQEHAGAESIERVGECGGFRRLEIDDPADQHGPAKVRDEQPHALARRVVGKPVALVPEDDMAGLCRRRPLQNDMDIVDPALRLDPLLVQAGFEELVLRNEQRVAGNFANAEDVEGRTHRVELGIFVEIELRVAWLGADLIVDLARPAGGIHYVKSRRAAADESIDPFERRRPQGSVKSCVVDVANQRGEALRLSHGDPPETLPAQISPIPRIRINRSEDIARASGHATAR